MISNVDLRRWLLWTIIVSACWPSRVFGQRGQDAGLLGTVHDVSGSILPGAVVTVSSPQLIGGSQTSTTDAVGTYRFRFLSAGEYQMVAELAGFKSAERVGVTL